MLPITPKGFRRYVRFNATRKGLFGGSKLWLTVFAAGKLREFSGRLTKSGEAPVVFSGSLDSGHWAEVVHEKPRPSAADVRAGQKAAKRAKRSARRAEASPTRGNVRRAVRSQVRAAARNRELGPQRTAVEPLRVDHAMLTRRQRRQLKKARRQPLNPLERLDRRAIRDYP